MTVDKERLAQAVAAIGPAPDWYQDAVQRCSKSTPSHDFKAFERCTEDAYRLGISPEQYRTDVPAPGPPNAIPQARVHPLAVLAIALLVLAGMAWFTFVASFGVAPMPPRPSREAVLERQVGDLSTHVVELEHRNAATLAALDSFVGSPTPTPAPPIWTYTGHQSRQSDN